MSAALGGKIEAVKLLLERGAEVNAKDSSGSTALVGAACSGQTNVVGLLLDNGADINANAMWDGTPLMEAAHDDKIEVVKLLLARGADISATDGEGQTALDVARKKGNVAIVQLLQQIENPVNAVVASGTNTDSSGYVTNETLLTPFTLTNSVGDVITNAVLVKLTANKFVYKTDAGGMGMLPLVSLPEDLQKKFGYDAQAAQAADDAEQAKKVRQQQIVQQQQEIAVQQANAKAQSQAAVSDVSSSIRAYAEKKWPADYEMQKYEIDKQTEAYNWVVTATSATGVPQGVFDQIKSDAVNKWSDEYDMQQYEIEKQVKAYTDLH
jgi:hypothetical protein